MKPTPLQILQARTSARLNRYYRPEELKIALFALTGAFLGNFPSADLAVDYAARNPIPGGIAIAGLWDA